MPQDLMNGGLLILLTSTIYLGIAISFVIQRWNALSRKGRPAADPICREQLGDGLVAALVFLAVVLVEPPNDRMAGGIALGLLMLVLMVRLVRRVRRSASLGQ